MRPQPVLRAVDDQERLTASLDLDLMTSREVVDLVLREEARVPDAVAAAAEAIAAAAEGVAERLRTGGRLFYVGAGTSGRLAFLDAAELPPTFGVSFDLVQVILAGGADAILAAVEGAEDDERAAVAAVRARVTRADAVVGVAASGATPFTVAATHEARQLGAFTVGVSGEAGAPLVQVAEVAVVVATGPEVVMGSTRMKAGTAQKLVLNALSTAVMVRLGRVHSNLMVDMPASNQKLRRRAVRMVELAAGVAPEVAERALVATGWSTRTAIVGAALGLSRDEAEERLQAAGHDLRRALTP